MPILLHDNIDELTSIAVWKVDEPEEFFLDGLSLNHEEKELLDGLNSRRKMEWLSSRYLIKKLYSDEGAYINLLKDEYGKPYIENSPKFVSLSHSHNMVAAIISDVLVGIDIQKEVSKISRIQHKFISEQESARIDQGNLTYAYHVFWGAKESMYKAYGKKEVDFKKHMYLYPFKCFDDRLELKSFLQKDNIRQEYNVFAQRINDFYLVYTIIE